MKKLTPILVVDAIEPCLPFWTQRLGFTVNAEVPEGDRLGFVMFQQGRYAEAVEAYGNLASLLSREEKEFSSYLSALLMLGIAYERLGDRQSAESSWKTVVDMAPRSPQAREAARLIGR